MGANLEKELDKIVNQATDRHKTIPRDWMPVSRIRPLIFEDPAVLWLEFHGEDDGFRPDSTPYDFLDFYNEKSRQFERRWLEEFAPQAVAVCKDPYLAYYAEKARETVKRMLQGRSLPGRPCGGHRSESTACRT